MKTLNHALRTILLIITLIGTTTTATAYDFMVNGIYYNINGNNATVTYQYREYYNNGSLNYYYYNSNTGKVTIPETVTFNGETYTVTAIGDHAFCHHGHEGITGISIPSTITSIGNSAFESCHGLDEVIIPESVVSIGGSAFWNCSGLSNVIKKYCYRYFCK